MSLQIDLSKLMEKFIELRKQYHDYQIDNDDFKNMSHDEQIEHLDKLKIVTDHGKHLYLVFRCSAESIVDYIKLMDVAERALFYERIDPFVINT